jgi:trehalose 6-phosphate synthase/phosphatase
MQAGEKQLVLTTEERVIIVAYHLPLRVDRASNGYSIEWDDERGIDKHGMGLPLKVTYVGCIELDVPDMAEQEALEKLLFEQYNCIVIFLESKLRDKFYHRFCRLYLAPVMHNQMHVMEDVDPFQPDEWRAYCVVNQLFASKVMLRHCRHLPLASPPPSPPHTPNTPTPNPHKPLTPILGDGGLLGR